MAKRDTGAEEKTAVEKGAAPKGPKGDKRGHGAGVLAALRSPVTAVCAACLVGAVAVGAWGVARAGALDEEAQAKMEEVKELSKRLDIAKATVTEPEELQEAASTAQELGEQVAALQNGMDALEGEDRQERVAGLSQCFYGSSSATTSWCPGGTWSFGTVLDLSADNVSVCWTCLDADGNLMAYATADWEAEDGLFRNWELHRATAANAEAQGGTDTSAIEELAKEAATIDMGETTEDMTDLSEARERLREQGVDATDYEPEGEAEA